MKNFLLALVALIAMFLFTAVPAMAHGHGGRYHGGVSIGLNLGLGVPMYYGYNYYPAPVIYTQAPPVTNTPSSIAYSPQTYRTPDGIEYVYTTYFPQSCTVMIQTFHHDYDGRVWVESRQYGGCYYGR